MTPDRRTYKPARLRGVSDLFVGPMRLKMCRRKVPAINSAPTLWAIRFERSLLGKREFIQRFGRANWGYLCQRWPHHIVKSGKRAYVTAEAVEDQLWNKSTSK